MTRALAALLTLILAAGALAAEAPPPPGEEEAAAAVHRQPLVRAARGIKDIVISPIEIPATMRRVGRDHNALFGLWAGALEGCGNGLARLTAGALELVTAPIPYFYLPLYNKRLGERATPRDRPPTGITRP
jgi:putative exosortase-associated protein (TIGR04073 family)